MLESLLFLLVVVTWIYWPVAWWVERAFFRSVPEPDVDFATPVSILKPVKGLDAQAYQNFATYCAQDYGEYELLFGVADPADPAIPIVVRLQQVFSERSIRLMVGQPIGANRKASLLNHLAAEARHDVMVISDSDVRVRLDYLRRVVNPLADDQIGLVTCPYRARDPRSLLAELEALHMGVTFLPSAIVAGRLLRIPFAMGATMAVRRRDLARMGGFKVFFDYLADGFQLGARIADLGLKVHLSNYVVSNVLGTSTFSEEWHRELRWARSTRVSRPREYPGLLLTFSTPLALLLLLFSGFAPIA